MIAAILVSFFMGMSMGESRARNYITEEKYVCSITTSLEGRYRTCYNLVQDGEKKSYELRNH